MRAAPHRFQATAGDGVDNRLLARRKCPSDKSPKPLVEYQSRLKPRINKLRFIRLNRDKRNKEEIALSKSEAMTAENRLDRLGAAASLACAAHCAAMPLLIGLLPLVGLGFLAKEQTEWALVGFSLGVGSLSLIPSYARKHRQWRPLLLFAFGASLIVVVRLCIEDGSRLEAPAMVIGALLIACAHQVNRRLCRSCAACHRVGE